MHRLFLSSCCETTRPTIIDVTVTYTAKQAVPVHCDCDCDVCYDELFYFRYLLTMLCCWVACHNSFELGSVPKCNRLFLITSPTPPKISWTLIHTCWVSNPILWLKMPSFHVGKVKKTNPVSRPWSRSFPKSNRFVHGPYAIYSPSFMKIGPQIFDKQTDKPTALNKLPRSSVEV